MSGAHSLFAPSAAARWSRCIGSVALCRDSKDEPSEYAAEGTVYHEIASLCLTHPGRPELNAADFIGRDMSADGFTFAVTAENAAHVQVYIDAIRRIPGRRIVEVRLPLSDLLGIPDQGGTSDAVILQRGERMIQVHDLKFGRGEPVEATGNEQLLLYGMGAMYLFETIIDIDFVKVCIHQPRRGSYSEHTYTRAEVEVLFDDLKYAAQAAYLLYTANDPIRISSELVPGEKQCRWCPRKANCPARAGQMAKAFSLVSEAHKEISTLNDEQLASFLETAIRFESMAEDFRKEALARALNGRDIPGWKLVDGRKGPRKWKGDIKAIEAALVLTLGDHAYRPREMITAPVAEALLKKDHAAQWEQLQGSIEQAPGNKTLAPLSDIRAPQSVGKVEFGLAPGATI